MKRCTIRWTFFAAHMLEEIHGYVKEESGSEQKADAVVAGILVRVEQLEEFPESGRKEPLLEEEGGQARYLVGGSYKIIYEHSGDEVIVLDVFHTKRNPKKLRRR